MMYKPTKEFYELLKKRDEFIVSCYTEKQARALLKTLNENWFKWIDGTDLLKHINFDPHMNFTDYYIKAHDGTVAFDKSLVLTGYLFDRLFTVEETEQTEEINHPSRYKSGKYECIDVMEDVFGNEAVKDFCILNAFKYLWRYKHKGGCEDVSKAAWYCNKAVEIMRGEKNESI